MMAGRSRGLKARLVTGDPEFRRLEKDIPIDWLAR
jgi:hypothetical protein